MSASRDACTFSGRCRFSTFTSVIEMQCKIRGFSEIGAPLQQSSFANSYDRQTVALIFICRGFLSIFVVWLTKPR